jgi:Tol biopolymer transport system component
MSVPAWTAFAVFGIAAVSGLARIGPAIGAERTGGISPVARVGFVRGGSVYTISPSGGAVRLVLKAHPSQATAANPVIYSEPAWSSRGGYLAVHASTFESHEYQHVWVFDRKMKHVATFDSLYGAGGDSPSWSPDGRRLTFSDIWGGWIYVARLSGRVRALVDHFGAPPYDWGPAWSPDGRTIAFSRGTATGPAEEVDAQLYLVGASGGPLRRLAQVVAVNPAWSPNSRLIAFDDHTRIGVIRPDGRGLRYLIRGTHPAWSPDGRVIAFERGNSIWLLSLGEKTPRLLVKRAADPVWTHN